MKIKRLTFLTVFFLFALCSSAAAATVNITNVEDLEGKRTAVAKWRITLDVSFSSKNEKSVIAEIQYPPEIKKDPAVLLVANNTEGNNSYTGLRHTAGKLTHKVVYYVITWDGRKTKLAEFTPGVGMGTPEPATATPPSITEPPVIRDDGIKIETGLPGAAVTVDGIDKEYRTNSKGTVFIEFENMEDSDYDFSWEFRGGKLVYNYDDDDGEITSYYQPGNMINGRFVPWSGSHNRKQCSFPPCEIPMPDGEIYYRVQIVDDDSGDVLEEWVIGEDGVVGGEQVEFPLGVTIIGGDGNEYRYIIDEDGSVRVIGDTFDDSEINPGDEWGGDGDSEGCNICELLTCPGWEEVAGMIGDAVGKHIPPPPDWNQVADTFADVMVPRVGQEMRNAMEDVLGHPQAPDMIPEPEVPNFEDIAEDIETPQPVDSTPAAGKKSFDDVPDIEVIPDFTGGIDLSGADPIDRIPHDPEGKKPIPGQETGGITPETQPTTAPIPVHTQPPGNPLPTPAQSSDEIPTPGTTTGPPPSPDATTSPIPKPEMPFPGGSS